MSPEPAAGKNQINSKKPHFFFSRGGLILLTAILIAAGWWGESLLVFLTGTMLIVIAVSRVWSGLSLIRLRYRRELKETRAFPGDEVELVIVLENRKPLPLLWIDLNETLPLALAPEKFPLQPGVEPGTGLLASTAWLLWYKRLSRTYKLKCRRRGYYRLGPSLVVTGDGFGFYPRALVKKEADYVVVYPKIYDLGEFGLPACFPLGEAKTTSCIFEDPSRTIGLRQYTPDVPFKNIHWKASARHQELQVKVLESTTTLKVLLFLDVDGFGEAGAEENPDFEWAVNLTASLADHLVRLEQPVGLFVNTVCQGQENGPVCIQPGADSEHIIGLLEALARINPVPSLPFSEFFMEWAVNLPYGSTLCVITGKLSELLHDPLSGLGQSGFRIMVFEVGEEAATSGPFVCQNIRRPDDLNIDFGER